MAYEAFVVSESSRQAIAAIYPPKYEWVGHHVTHRFPAPVVHNVPYGGRTHGDFEIVGYASDEGIEAFVVSVRGQIVRPDGRIYHLTWSIDREKGWKPVDSNRVIAERGYHCIEPYKFYAAFDRIG